MREEIETIKSVLPSSIHVYSSYVPENASLPAIALNNVGFPSSRNLNGKKTRKQEVWRISVVATNIDSMYSVRDLILSLDNSSNEHYQRIMIDVVNEEARGVDEPNIRMFIDMTCTI